MLPAVPVGLIVPCRIERVSSSAGWVIVLMRSRALYGSLDCLKTFGTLVSFGQSSGPADDFRISHLARGSLRLQRPTLFHYAASRAWLEAAANELFTTIANGTLKIHIAAERPLTEAAEAHDALEGRQTTGSTVLIP